MQPAKFLLAWPSCHVSIGLRSWFPIRRWLEESGQRKANTPTIDWCQDDFFSPIISLKRNGSPAVNEEVEFWTLSAWFLRGRLDLRQHFHEPGGNWASLGEYCFPIFPSHYLFPLFPLFPPTSSFDWFFSLLHPVGCRCRQRNVTSFATEI